MEREKYDVIVSDDALSMLDRHAEFLAKVSKSAAKKAMGKIFEDIESLSTLPERYPVYENQFIPFGRYRKMTSGKRYLIIYEIAGSDVYVDYILDCRQDNIIAGIPE